MNCIQVYIVTNSVTDVFKVAVTIFSSHLSPVVIALSSKQTLTRLPLIHSIVMVHRDTSRFVAKML